MGRYQASLEHKGHLLGRIVDIGAELYAIACACVYAKTIGREEAYELAALFSCQARRRADRLFDELFDNDDKPQYAAAQQVLDGRYSWFEADMLDPANAANSATRRSARLRASSRSSARLKRDEASAPSAGATA
jgi:hypothetical protein